MEMSKAYEPKSFEERIYSKWSEGGYFKPASDNGTYANETYSVVIPPPNVTGVLHAGHALNNTLQDIVVRYHRMKGDNTLWVTGTDHAGIATQNVVERALKKEGKTKTDVGREEFLRRTWAVKEEHHNTIVKQQKALGNSTDWERERFTMDEGLSKAVRDVFVTLYERGLIYKGHYLVNWCPRCGTALADDEVEHIDTAGAMYHIYYEYTDGSGRIEVATTRPETFFGDTAVAVNPDDERYKALVGKTVRLPLTDKEIPIIEDSYVDKDFGTGMVKITPAHDPNDWEVGKRHNLEIVNILNPDGTLNENVPKKYRGMKAEAARKAVVEDLEAVGAFKGEEKITHSVGHCYRCNSVVEPYLSDQWFVKMKPLAQKALAAWEKGEIVFYPRKWENTYKQWMENIRDWCISRQLWWGHRIPVWECKKCGEVIVSRTDPQKCPKCGAGAAELVQDEDVLDTWFSSWLWPFSVLGWPEATEDMKRFYPTTALVTAYDIIFFWVSRMIMAGLEFTGRVPFRDIYIHGLVRDKQGRKMSKSLGNGIDPLDIIATYGSDALRFTLCFMCAQGQDVLIDKESFKLGSRFANKVWNASRYILGNLDNPSLRGSQAAEAILEHYEIASQATQDDKIAMTKIVSNGVMLTEIDKWIYSRLDAAARAAREALEGYRYNDAASTVMEYFWNEFCDWYVEMTKLSFKNGDETEKSRALSVLLNVLEENLRLLHPFLPFVTEEIYGFLPDAGKTSAMLITAEYPAPCDERRDGAAEERVDVLRSIVGAIRALRTECGIEPSAKILVAVKVESKAAQICKERTDVIELMAGVAKAEFVAEKPARSIGSVGKGFEVFLVMDESVDKEAIAAKLKKSLDTQTALAAKCRAKLSGNFALHAAAEAVEEERQKLAEMERRIEKLGEYLADIRG